MYIPDNGMGIKDLEFNFSPNYHFSLNREERKFYMSRKEVLPRNWFGHNILNVTAIVGKNGAGKTNLIKALIDSLCYQGGCVQFYEYNGEIWTNYTELRDIDERKSYKFDFPVHKIKTWASPLKKANKDDDQYLKDSKVLYYSSAIDRQMRQAEQPGYFRDLSNGCLLRHQREREINTIHNGDTQDFRISDVDEMQLKDIQQQLLFFHYVDKYKVLPADLKIPEWLNVSLRLPVINTKATNSFRSLSRNEREDFVGSLCYFLLYQLSSISQSDKWNENSDIDNILNSLNRQHNTDTNLFRKMKELYENGYISYNSYQQHNNILEFKIKVSSIDYDTIDQLYRYYYLFEIPYTSLQNTYLAEDFSNDLVIFSWGLSSGERNFLTLLSRIYCAIMYKNGGEVYVPSEHDVRYSRGKKGTSWLLILDEPDISLHPEWQRKFLNLLLKTLGGLFPDYVFQIIITTHSPILLSDIPKSNTILLDKENDKCNVKLAKKETFGANIYSLYNDSFFLKGIPIGEFAKDKLKRIENILKDKNQKIDDSVINDIYRIGEPVIKNYFLKLLDERRQSMSRTDRLQSLYNEIQRAEEDDKA